MHPPEQYPERRFRLEGGRLLREEPICLDHALHLVESWGRQEDRRGVVAVRVRQGVRGAVMVGDAGGAVPQRGHEAVVEGLDLDTVRARAHVHPQPALVVGGDQDAGGQGGQGLGLMGGPGDDAHRTRCDRDVVDAGAVQDSVDGALLMILQYIAEIIKLFEEGDFE